MLRHWKRNPAGNKRAASAKGTRSEHSERWHTKQSKFPATERRFASSPIILLEVPDRPILPFIEGDGTGPDIWRASQYVFDAAVKKVYGGKRKIAWMEVYAGEKAFKQFNSWLPDETVEAFANIWSGSRDR